MFAKAIDILCGTDCSPGAARLALRWWLANVARQLETRRIQVIRVYREVKVQY